MDTNLVLITVGITLILVLLTTFSMLITYLFFKIKRNTNEMINKIDSLFPPMTDMEMSEILKRALAPDIFQEPGGRKIIFKSSDGKFTANSPEELMDKITQDMQNREEDDDEEEKPHLTQEDTDRLKNYFNDMIDRETRRQKNDDEDEEKE